METRNLACALYGRVSTSDCKCPKCGHSWTVKAYAEDNPPCPKCGTLSEKRQEVKNQLAQLREFCARNGWTVYREYVDHESGGSGKIRLQFNDMLKDASQRKFDVLLFWALDRLTREGTLKTLEYLNLLSGYGVGFRSFTEAYLDSCGMWKDAIIGILATIAKQEHVRIKERVRAGIDRCKREGRKWGRPRLDIDLRPLRAARAQGETYQSIVNRFGVSIGFAHRACKDVIVTRSA